PELDDAPHEPVHAVHEPRLVRRGARVLGEEDAQQVDDLRARQHEARVPALGVRLREPLAQQREEQAHVERQLAARDEPRHALVALVLGLRAQVRVAVALVDDDLQPEHRDGVAHLGLAREQVAPQRLAGLAVDDALEQRRDDDGQLRVARGAGRAHGVSSGAWSGAGRWSVTRSGGAGGPGGAPDPVRRAYVTRGRRATRTTGSGAPSPTTGPAGASPSHRTSSVRSSSCTTTNRGSSSDRYVTSSARPCSSGASASRSASATSPGPPGAESVARTVRASRSGSTCTWS